MPLVTSSEHQKLLRIGQLNTFPNISPQMIGAKVGCKTSGSEIQIGRQYMAAGAAPAPERKADSKAEATETGKAQPMTLKQRIVDVLSKIFEGHEDHSGWHQ